MNPPVETSTDRSANAPKTEIVELLKELELRPFLGKDRALCQAFYEDFGQQKNITYIQPIIRTDDYDDPELKPYKEKCPHLELNKHMAFEARSFEEVMKLPEDERETYAVSISYGTRNFKMFRVDINNNPADGDHYVYYDEAHLFVRPPSLEGRIPVLQAGDYRVVDFAHCEVVGGARVADIFTRISDAVTTSHGIIRYRGKHYIYSIEAIDSGHGRLSLNGYARTPDGKQRLGSICAYRN